MNDQRKRGQRLMPAEKAIQAFDSFHKRFSDVFGKLIRLECEFRSLGSTGPIMIAERNFRKALEGVMFVYGSYLLHASAEDMELDKRVSSLVKPVEIFPRYNFRDVNKAFTMLSTASAQFLQELYSFLGIYYNYPLTRTLVDLGYHLNFYLKEKSQREEDCDEIDVTSMKGHIRYVFIEVEKIMPRLGASILETIETGVPLLRVKQKEFTWRYMNMTTIAIFFAGLTVAMLQYTFEKTDTELASTVNTLLFLSLALSISSGALNLLVLSWRHSYVRSPEAMSRQWQSTCILSSPIACLAVSGALFVAALCMFLFSSNQDKDRTSLIVVAFAGVLTFIVLGLLITFALHQLKFRRIASDSGLSLHNVMITREMAEWMRNSNTEKPVLPKDLETPPLSRAVTGISSIMSISPTLRNSVEGRSPSRTPSPNCESGRPTPQRSWTATEDEKVPTNPNPLPPSSLCNTPAANGRTGGEQHASEDMKNLEEKGDSQGNVESAADDDFVAINPNPPPNMSSNNRYT